MNKFKAVVILIVIGILGNLFLTVGIPFVADVAITTNQTLATSSNMSNYAGTSEFLLAAPWVMYLLFNMIVLAVLVLTLRARTANA